MPYQSVNPFDGALLGSFPEISEAALSAKLAVAAECFENWRRSSFDYRAKIAGRVADLMRAQLEALARPVTLEMGKLIEQSRSEVSLSADIIEYYANNAERFLATQGLSPGHDREQPDRRAVRRAALELPLLSARPVRGAEPDGRQCGDGEACRLRAAMRARVREAVAGGWRASRRLHQSLHLL
jgi:hypothetical protein